MRESAMPPLNSTTKRMLMLQNSNPRCQATGLRKTLRAATVATTLVWSGACSPDLPEFYGLYLSDGSGWQGLTAYTDNPKPLEGELSILVYDKGVAAGSFDASTGIRLFRAVSIRYEVEEQLNKPGGVVNRLKLHRNGDLRAATPVPMKTRPIRGNPEMVEFVPEEQLEPGAYLLYSEAGSPSDGRPVIYVQMPPDNLLTMSYPYCRDRYTQTVDNTKGFSWSAFRRQVQGGLSGEAYSKSGRVIMSEEFRPCDDWERSPDFVARQRNLREFTKSIIGNVHDALFNLIAYGPEKGLDVEAELGAGRWVLLNGDLVMEFCEKFLGYSCPIESEDSWGRLLQYYIAEDLLAKKNLYNSERPILLVRSAGSDGKFETEGTYDQRRPVGSDEFHRDLVSGGFWQ